MFDWFAPKRKRIEPESRWTVTLDGDAIRITDEAGTSATLELVNLAGVAIETNDSGPWGADFWWMLFDAEGRMACTFPQGATGEQAVIDYLMILPGYDHGEMIKALRSTSNAVFPVWRRPGR